MPVGIDVVTITITSGARTLASCSFSLEVTPFGADPWTVATGPLTQTNRIVVPIRWCAVRGSRLAEDSRWLDRSLWARSGLASTIYLRAGTGIEFRSAMMSDIATSTAASFPVIDDPRPLGPGELGDIEIPTLGNQDVPELREAIASCRTAWDSLEQQLGVNIEGILALNVRGLVQSGLTVHVLGIGFGFHNVAAAPGTDACTQPTSVVTNDGVLLVTDGEVVPFAPGFPPSDPHDKLLAHELGHTLFLGHGNGVDDDNNGLVDQFCDQLENPDAASQSLMTPILSQTTEVITAAQRTTARPIAAVTKGAQRFNSPGVSDAVGDDRPDLPGDVPDASIDLAVFGIARNSLLQDVVSVSHRLHGLLPTGAASFDDRQFVAFLDVDGDPMTGGMPSALGYPTTFQGAEFVTAATVSATGNGRTVSARVWRFSGGSFVNVADPGIAALIQTAMASMDSGTLPIADSVVLTIPNRVAGTWSPSIRFQALSSKGADVDRLPDAGAAVLSFSPPHFPECSIAPPLPRPGESVTLTATGFVPNQRVAAFTGDRAVATGVVDASGMAVLPFTVPATAVEGSHPIVVGEIGSALNAHCGLVALNPDVTAPTLSVPGAIVVDATGAAGAVVTYSVTAIDDRDPSPVITCSPPSGSVFPLSTTTVSCTATDASGNSASASFTVTVKDASQQVADLTGLIRSWNFKTRASLLNKLARIQGFLNSGDAAQACENLNAFLHEVRAGWQELDDRSGRGADRQGAADQKRHRVLSGPS